MEEKKLITPRNYILTTYNIISQEGMDAVSIRRLGRELSCNTANLYRYFNDLDELIVYASLRYLRSYLAEVSDYYSISKNGLELHLKVWECFSRHSFANPRVFNNLFFGKHSNALDRIIQDYYTLFPDDISDLDANLTKVYTAGNFDYRDYLMLVNCVDEGWFLAENAHFLNTLSVQLYKGFLKDILDGRLKPGDERASNQDFMACLTEVLNKYRLK